MKGSDGKKETAAGQALQDSELRCRRLFEAAQDGILILDAGTGAITDVNPFLIHMLGYTREECLRAADRALYHDKHEGRDRIGMANRESRIRGFAGK